MSVEQTDIEKIAKLSRIRIAASDMPEVALRLNDILAMVDTMQAVDTTGIEPMHNPLDASQRLRADIVTETDQRELLQQNAPAAEQGLFLVPKVIE
ncbi:Asp-tRNA(Asn)/Glu-tRNA(Gln) amidotransferase subunit GatC [Dasania sp. GY-MA-18]|uniref:Aspartyl/glutamyl-tRNA(Asn/Gln) amidotransferase subunit C n=1 Tax=Dasania phycosphaerae TaxID=2950436 RepID=A0A9J6RIC6_9GAMM|nr:MULTISPECIES: Asp-tRNA(Asn)/Glu-tRNA(Gln) amidotransferase subunit GatC [Dasania]MCR8921588.1 Asp-tRNA(Asn)/Glu-tRNA(Gln) amidotransferase subunit GatC [Dasania sp. GY-MA-18]MCZ0864016.1 Asp-tRNA(Asn)/Glu-tRNA(Gln) amidotransferase subunit GatC [Dasania phycosphaerae]MCZ0867744.1 Asp-tRNA(Asn)/Glu-tRNA(Gln) amidotransferase subunit GatC [Dasania phycosphaerae]